MQKLWGLLFGVVLLGCFLLVVAALFVVPEKWGLPPNIAEGYGDKVDDLFFLILIFTGFFYVLTEVLLVVALFLFTDKPGRRATYTHGNHRLELSWTIIPAAILLYIALAQVKTWEDIKYQSHSPDPDQVLQVTAKQWEWRLRYSGEESTNKDELEARPEERRSEWAETPEFDDVHVVNDLHTWKNAKVKLHLKTSDIMHSFFLPNLRLKQDALPGKTIPMWFQPNDSNAHFDAATGKTIDLRTKKPWEIACAELCGGGHYRMRGRLIVHDTKDNYEAWLKYTKAQQSSREPEKSETPAE